jgi:hypothetical protein
MNTIKTIGKCAGYFLIMVAVILGIDLFFYGTGWVAEKILPALNWIATIWMLIMVVVGTPFLFSRKTRGLVGFGWMQWGGFTAIIIWLTCLVVVLQIWGIWAAILGVILAGIGIVPVALAALAIHSEWAVFWVILGTIGMIWGARGFGFLMMTKSDWND